MMGSDKEVRQQVREIELAEYRASIDKLSDAQCREVMRIILHSKLPYAHHPFIDHLLDSFPESAFRGHLYACERHWQLRETIGFAADYVVTGSTWPNCC